MEGCAVDNDERSGTAMCHHVIGTPADQAGHFLLCTRRTMDPHTQWLAALEPISKVQWPRRRRENTAMVVGRQQLEGSRREVTDEGHEAGKECVRGEWCLPECPAPQSNYVTQAY
jgi:hypothetical protein